MSLMPTYLILVIAAISTTKTFAQTNQTSKPCRLKKFDSGFVCVCTDDYCDTLKVPIPKENGYILATSSESGQRFNITEGEFNPKDNGTAKYCDLSKTCVKIDRGKVRPKIVGFGASFTGAVSTVLNKLSSNLRDCVYKSFYSSSDGLASNLMRISIGGSDCDEYPWAYNEYPLNDTKLTNFTVHPIDRLRIQQLHDLINVSENRDIKITAAVWSPPRWMKPHYRWSGTNNNGLKREYYQTYADYHLKFLDLMNSSQIPIWAISTGNEPGISQLTPFIGLSWQATNQGKWLAENLGPTLKSSNHSHVQIHVLDDNRNYLPLWLYFMDLGNKTALDYASAVAVHGYLDGSTSPYVLDFTFDVFEKPILYTEMSYGLGTLDGILHPGPLLGSWNRAERLTINLIDLLSHYVTAYIDWNMILNFQGGPNYVDNVLDAPIIASENFTEIYKQPMFYAFAHFSKFIRVDCQWIESYMTGWKALKIKSIAFQCPDGDVSVILYNQHPTKTIPVFVLDNLKGSIELKLSPKSINTISYRL